VHVPTGAQFWKGEKDVVNCEWGNAGEPLPSGNVYDRTELSEAAREIFLLARVDGVG
jgi:hypothetical protein